MPKSSKPAVSIVLPTYNRARFLPEAFDAIKNQTFKDWELIVVDDGSTDNTKQIVKEFAEAFPQNVVYVYQENQGPAAARNKGLEIAQGRYIAFYDSDDLWLPHHLEKCVTALEKNPDVSWVFAACKLVEYPSGKVVNPNHLYEPDGSPRGVKKLAVEKRDELFLIKDQKAALKCAIVEGLRAGLQNSVIRAEIFKKYRLNPQFRVGEDHLLVLQLLKAGFRFAYFDNVHVIYRMHEKNLSLAGRAKDLEEQTKVHLAFIQALAAIGPALSWREKQILGKRIADIYFWNIGYQFFLAGDHKKARFYFKKGLRHYPFCLSFWKTFFGCLLRSMRGS